MAVALYRNGSGSIGQISATSNVATPTITVTDLESITNFEKSMVLQVSATDGTGAVRTGTVTIVGLDRDLGTITVSGNWNAGIAAVAVNDFLFRNGDYALKIKGLQAWLPNTAPTAGDSFFSVDRSSDASRLAGIRFDGSAMPIEEALVKAASRTAREGGKPEYCFISYTKYADLENALGSKVQYIDMKVNPEIAFRGIQINGPRGPIKVVPDVSCPGDRAFMLQMNVWKLYSLGKCPQILDTDGLKMLRQATADGVEVRIGLTNEWVH